MRYGFERSDPISELDMMLSGPSEARFADHHVGLLMMMNSCSKSIRLTIVTLFILLPLKGIIMVCNWKRTDLFYYLIDAGEFSYSNDMHETTISGSS